MSYRVPVLALVALAASILFQDSLFSVYIKFFPSRVLSLSETKINSNVLNNSLLVYSLAQLSSYNGIKNNKLFLAITGHIFDVSKGSRHYGPEAPYHYFIGKDGSRAFITGNFKDESVDKDHILDLKCNDLITLSNWKKSLEEKYEYVGVLSGRYFDSNGEETPYTQQFHEKLIQCTNEKEIQKKMDEKYPPCNSEWSVESGTRVWCSESSGGISRSWIGVPRLYYTPGEDKPRCVCVNLNDNNSEGKFKEYKNCSPISSSCMIEKKLGVRIKK